MDSSVFTSTMRVSKLQSSSSECQSFGLRMDGVSGDLLYG